MLVRLFDGSIRTTPALLTRVTDKVSHALAAVASRVVEVTVRIADENAAKGGRDKRCRIVAQLAHAKPVIVEAHHSDYYAAVDAAAAKLKRAANHRAHRAH